jgi:23S rRNA (adenine2503-C2)-methyltransferase
MYNVYDFTLEKLEKLLVEQYGQKKYRATQLFIWLYEKKAKSFDEMTDVAVSFREVLKRDFTVTLPTIDTKQVASDGTIKLLLKMSDDAKVETVLMKYDFGNSICVSSQVGCNMGCAFCASGLLKKSRDLTPGEMLGQILVMESLMEGERVSHVVVMGTGEPFDNYDNVMDFIRIINNPKSLAIGARHITVSTCGLADKIVQYSKEGLQINLAISLHASNNDIRNRLMKINKAYPLEDLMVAIKQYEKNANRRVTFEYILLDGINDSVKHAEELAALIKGTTNYVNLIPYNSVEENEFKRSSRENVRKFCDRLKSLGVNVTIRKEFGIDIDAACGQLRAKREGAI